MQLLETGFILESVYFGLCWVVAACRPSPAAVSRGLRRGAQASPAAASLVAGRQPETHRLQWVRL